MIAPDDDHFEWLPAEFFESHGIPDPLNPGTVSPHPISLTDFLTRLWIVDRSSARVTGYADIAVELADLRAQSSELDAWYLRAMSRRGLRLAPAVGRAFGLDTAQARTVGHVYAMLDDSLSTDEVAAHVSVLAGIPSTGAAIPR